MMRALMSILVVCLVLPPVPAMAAGAFGAPPLKNIFQIRFDDDTRELVYPNAIAYDPVLEEIYVNNAGSLRVVVYGPDFFPRVSIGSGRGLISPTGLAVLANGEVFVCQVRTSLNPTPRITVLNGAFFVDREIYLDEIPEAAGFIPKVIAINREGLIYLVGEDSRGLMVLDNEGSFLRWLQPTDMIYARNRLEEGMSPTGVQLQPKEEQDLAAVNDEDELLPEDDPYANIPAEFRPVASGSDDALIGSKKVEGPVVLNFVTIASNGNLYMTSNETGKIYVYGPDENFLFSFGTKGGSPGQLSQPRAVALDEEQELIYVADYMRHTILIYNLEGEYLFEVGGRGTDPGWFNFPTAMTINKHRQIIVADLFNRRIQVLELGYEEWLRRGELEPPAEDIQFVEESDTEGESDQGELIQAPSDVTDDLTRQQESEQKRPEDEPGAGAQPEAPSGQPEINNTKEDLVPVTDQEQSEDVLEVIFEEMEIPAHPGSEEK
jgi:DNA-binding beta-propeller fold protein YncE